MQIITIHLENCYGISRLHHFFDFSDRKAYAVYAPNGSMKSSFAETFKNIADGEAPRDRIFPTRVSVCKITDEKGADLPPKSVLVLPPYDESFFPEQTSTLLVNSTLRREFDKLHADINKAKESFLTLMGLQSKSKKNIEKEISEAIMRYSGDEAFYLALVRVKNEVNEQKNAPFAKVDYDIIFDDKVIEAMGKKEFKAAIKDYITRYNLLLQASTYFQKGIFEYYNASQIAKALKDNGFFKAKHFVILNGAEKREISTVEQLEELIKNELEKITQDTDLKKKFGEVKKVLEKNIPVRVFKDYLCSNESLLPSLENSDRFKEDIWKSYFKSHEGAFNDLIDKYNQVKARRKEIQEEASKERSLWEDSINQFNERFFVPFKLEAKNRVAVALGQETTLNLGYTFKDGLGSAQVERETLLKSLSQGEKKALYILNIIFEIEVRKKDGQETLFVVDDIADSFDYKNKYAIIQYLADISDGQAFKQIILTHNFDFFRTIQSRFVGYSGCLMAIKSGNEVRLDPAVGIQNVFIKDWKLNFFTDGKKRIACISFMRNLIEYTHGDSDPAYIVLTSLLHWKSDTSTITGCALDSIYRTLFPSSTGSYLRPNELVIDLIKQEADACLMAQTGINFENKIVLAIAIRLLAERFMANKIANQTFLDGIKEKQTQKLLKEFRRTHPSDASAIKVLNLVALMTPENIHLNAFMYEPILDMSDDSLRKLYTDVIALP